jgi:hypothetical protein
MTAGETLEDTYLGGKAQQARADLKRGGIKGEAHANNTYWGEEERPWKLEKRTDGEDQFRSTIYPSTWIATR